MATGTINSFETGKTVTDLSLISPLRDGPVKPGMKNGQRQMTLGKGYTEYGGSTPSTSNSGNLKDVFENYINNPASDKTNVNNLKNLLDSRGVTVDSNGKLKGFAPKEGKSLISDDGSETLNKEALKQFQDLFKTMNGELPGTNKDPNWGKAQEDVYKKKYSDPAQKFCNENGITTPLGYLTVLDSYVHSGMIYGKTVNPKTGKVKSTFGYEKSKEEWDALKAAADAAAIARNAYLANPTTGNRDRCEVANAKTLEKEKAAITKYSQERANSLNNSSRNDLHNTSFRSDIYNREAQKGNFELEQNIYDHKNNKVIAKADNMDTVDTGVYLNSKTGVTAGSVPIYAPPKATKIK